MEYNLDMDKPIRIDEYTHKLLSALARQHKRTIKGEVEHLIEQEYDKPFSSLDASPVGVEATK